MVDFEMSNTVDSYFPIYQASVYPFNPIIVDMQQFEIDICSYLDAYGTGELKYPTVVSPRWATEKSIGVISLILAMLSSAAHFSDDNGQERFNICYELARRSFQALRLANFLFSPCLETIEAMLVLGHTLQNTGQSDAAWAWMGTTARLAQTLNFHKVNHMHGPLEAAKSKAKLCWQVSMSPHSYRHLLNLI